MAKWYGTIGYAETVEQPENSGIWVETITERSYYGDVIRNSRRLESAGQVNDNVFVSNQISIVADPFANQNFHAMRYAEFMGTKWKITNVEVQYPRLLLTLGVKYNAEQA